MNVLSVLLIAGIVFGVCFLVDKGFTRLFRNKKQHQTGLSVRLNKRFALVGLGAALLGIAALVSGIPGNLFFVVAGSFLLLLGIALISYYLSFGIFYDDDSFLVTSFGKREKTYYYRDICCQQLFNSAGNIVIELHFSDGETLQLQSAMDGVYPFLDKAFWSWLRQSGRTKESCEFYDPDNSCWFPPVEG